MVEKTPPPPPEGAGVASLVSTKRTQDHGLMVRDRDSDEVRDPETESDELTTR